MKTQLENHHVGWRNEPETSYLVDFRPFRFLTNLTHVITPK